MPSKKKAAEPNAKRKPSAAASGNKDAEVARPRAKKKAIRKPTTKKKATKKKATKKKATKKSPANRKRAPKKRVTKRREKSKRREPTLAERLFEKQNAQAISENVSPRTGVIERTIGGAELRAEFAIKAQELEAQCEAAERVVKRIQKWCRMGLFGEISGCSVALRVKDGRVVSPLRYGVEVHVPTKLPKEDLLVLDVRKVPKGKLKEGVRYLIPDSIDGVLVKVVESRPYRTSSQPGLESALELDPGTVKLKGGGLDNIKEKPTIDLANTELIGGLPTVDPIHPGNWGTFGIAFSNRIDETSRTTRYFGLANEHFADKDNDMVQPPHEPRDKTLWNIGTVRKTKNGAEGNYHVDAACIDLEGKRDVISRLVIGFGEEKFLFANRPLQRRPFFHTDVGRAVYKYGARTNHFVEGYIQEPEFATLRIPGDNRNLKTVIRAKSNGDKAFIQPGDSGSALVISARVAMPGEADQVRFIVVGLCFAGQEGRHDVLFACHFSHVIKALELKIPKTLLRDQWTYD